jgi:hypothetical protein
MIRTQLYLPEETHQKLQKLASQRKEPMAQLIREYVEVGLEQDKVATGGNAHLLLQLAKKAQEAGWTGKGPADLSINHDQYVAKAFEEDLERIHQHYDNNS